MEIYKSNSSGDVIVLERNGSECKVRFVNTGFERVADIHNVRAGKVKDTSIPFVSPTVEMDEVVETNTSGKLRILDKTGSKCTVQFVNTGYTTTALLGNIRAGKVNDPYAISRYGVGYDGEFKRPHYWKQARQLWSNMLKRCYCTNDPKGYYGKGVSVDARWLCFQNFVEDLPKLDNFQNWLDGQNGGAIKYNLDKDFKIEGNKVYSREVCVFLTESLNKSMGGKHLKSRMGNS